MCAKMKAVNFVKSIVTEMDKVTWLTMGEVTKRFYGISILVVVMLLFFSLIDILMNLII